MGPQGHEEHDGHREEDARDGHPRQGVDQDDADELERGEGRDGLCRGPGPASGGRRWRWRWRRCGERQSSFRRGGDGGGERSDRPPDSRAPGGVGAEPAQPVDHLRVPDPLFEERERESEREEEEKMGEKRKVRKKVERTRKTSKKENNNTHLEGHERKVSGDRAARDLAQQGTGEGAGEDGEVLEQRGDARLEGLEGLVVVMRRRRRKSGGGGGIGGLCRRRRRLFLLPRRRKRRPSPL